MAKNQSNSKKTIKDVFDAFSSDSWNIEKTLFYGNYENIITVPVENLLDKYRDYFENYLEEVEVPERCFYSPTMFSQIYYGTPDLDFLILYFANITSLFDFKKKKIKILPKTKLTELNQLFVKYKDEIENSNSFPEEYTELNDIIVKKQIYL